MYLSRLQLTTKTHVGRNILRNPYFLHQRLAAGFEADNRMLFRLEPLDGEQVMTVLVQSENPPNWQNAFDRFTLRQAETRQLAFDWKAGDSAIFRLLANPTKRNGESDKKARGIFEPENQVAWLTRKLAGAAALDSVQIAASSVRRSYRMGRRDEPHFAHLMVLFEGCLTVTDPQALRALLAAGIGRAKGFGCGLISLI